MLFHGIENIYKFWFKVGTLILCVLIFPFVLLKSYRLRRFGYIAFSKENLYVYHPNYVIPWSEISNVSFKKFIL